jgi:hypothetical protein
MENKSIEWINLAQYREQWNGCKGSIKDGIFLGWLSNY